MSTNLETRSAKSGKKPVDKFNPDSPHIILEGVGRLQRRGITYTLFELSGNKTLPFVQSFGGDVAFVAGGVKFLGDGSLAEPKKTGGSGKPKQANGKKNSHSTKAMGL